MSHVTKDVVRIGGTEILVVQGDLTTFRADCIVNAANGELNHRYGLAAAIVKAGALQPANNCHLVYGT